VPIPLTGRELLHALPERVENAGRQAGIPICRAERVATLCRPPPHRTQSPRQAKGERKVRGIHELIREWDIDEAPGGLVPGHA